MTEIIKKQNKEFGDKFGGQLLLTVGLSKTQNIKKFISKVRKEIVEYEKDRIIKIIKKEISDESYLKKCCKISKERYEKEVYANCALNYILRKIRK